MGRRRTMSEHRTVVAQGLDSCRDEIEIETFSCRELEITNLCATVRRARSTRSRSCTRAPPPPRRTSLAAPPHRSSCSATPSCRPRRGTSCCTAPRAGGRQVDRWPPSGAAAVVGCSWSWRCPAWTTSTPAASCTSTSSGAAFPLELALVEVEAMPTYRRSSLPSAHAPARMIYA